MDAFMHKTRLAVALAAATMLTACSEEPEPPVPNSDPVISIGTSVTATEGEVLEIPFTLSDANNTADELKVVLGLGDTQGSATVNRAEGVILYTGPWVRSGQSITDGFSVTVVDPAGARQDVDVSVKVEDIDSPVELVVNPPSQASEFQNTQTPDTLNFLFPEKSQLSVTFDITEEDADDLVSSFSISPEGVVFENQLEVEQGEDGGSVTLSLPIPDIKTASSQFALTFFVDDGDELVSAVANVTIVNKVGLNWVSGTPNEISEDQGGVLRYISSEGYDYDAQYAVSFTKPNGDELDFPVDYTLSTSTGEIRIAPNQGFQGNQSVKVVLSVSNLISDVGGESFVEETLLARSLVFIDDRDDDFSYKVNSFFSQVSTLEDVKLRGDEARVASAVSTYLFLNRFATKSESTAFKDSVVAAMTIEHDALSQLASQISVRLDAGEKGAEVEKMIDDFGGALSSVGVDAREVLREQVLAIASASASELPFNAVSASSFSATYEGRLTHFVGNSTYGFFADEAKQDWRFNDTYAYLSVVNISDPFCF